MSEDRLWVIEANFGNEAGWCPCTFVPPTERLPFVSGNFFEAHKMKRSIAAALSNHWNEDDFRVVEYVRKKE